MNSSSNIQISQSSLLSLKAEVLRKQQEINKAKILQQQQQQIQTPLREKIKKNVASEKPEPHNKGVEDRRANDYVEDEDLLQKSRKMLESKARLYDKLVKGPSNLNEEEIERNKFYLVQFDRKDKEKANDTSDEEHFSDEYETTNPEEEWIEYTDCLGRTRKCLRKDLEYLKEKDFEFSKTLDPERKKNIEENAQKWVTEQSKKLSEENDEPKNETITENNELLSSDMRRELLRQEWEKQEQELLDKKDIHYQDILFNEARSHGVGYYAFSKDAEERTKQQEELNKLRDETVKKQSNYYDQKLLREKQLAARLKAAKNRKRARLGLPPEEDEPEETTPSEEPEETEEEKFKKGTKEAEEKAKENARRRQIRPWDLGKEGVGKKHYEYSQEEWVDKKRRERQSEFAPPTNYQKENKKDKSETDKSLYFTTKKSKEKYRNSRHYHEDDELQTNFKQTPIVDETTDSDEEKHEKEETKRSKRKGTEIAPPPTFDYYGPSSTKNSKSSNSGHNLEDSIAAGLRYLREQAEKKEKSSHRRNFDDD